MPKLPNTSSSTAQSHYPPCPYVKDYTFTAYQHLPDTPPPERPTKTSPEEKKLCFDRHSRLQAILGFPAWLPGSTSRNTTVSRTMRVKQVLAGGDQHCPRVLLCSVSDGAKQPIDLVAKIYDPLYYPDPQLRTKPPAIESSEISFSMRARNDYNTEASIYRHLESHRDLVDPFIPKYYGSWTFDLDVPATNPPQTQKRSVCMILIEYINGASVYDLTHNPTGDRDFPMAENYEEAYITEVWSQCIKANARLVQAGVLNQDPSPKNVMITPDPSKTPSQPSSLGLRVVLIDFAWAEIREDLWEKANTFKGHWYFVKTRFWPMFPKGWFEKEVRHKWLIDHFGDEKTVKELQNSKHSELTQPTTQVPPTSQIPSKGQATPKTKIPPATNDQSRKGTQAQKQTEPPTKR